MAVCAWRGGRARHAPRPAGRREGSCWVRRVALLTNVRLKFHSGSRVLRGCLVCLFGAQRADLLRRQQRRRDQRSITPAPPHRRRGGSAGAPTPARSRTARAQPPAALLARRWPTPRRTPSTPCPKRPAMVCGRWSKAKNPPRSWRRKRSGSHRVGIAGLPTGAVAVHLGRPKVRLAHAVR